MFGRRSSRNVGCHQAKLLIYIGWCETLKVPTESSFSLLLPVFSCWGSIRPYLNLPYYWDELGQFVPAALDIYQHFDLIRGPRCPMCIRRE